MVHEADEESPHGVVAGDEERWQAQDGPVDEVTAMNAEEAWKQLRVAR